MKTKSLVILMAGIMSSYFAQAVDNVYIYGPDNSAIFELRFFAKGENYYSTDQITLSSSRNLNYIQQMKIYNAADYWANILYRNKGKIPYINIGTSNDSKVVSSSPLISTFYAGHPSMNITALQADLQGKRVSIPPEEGYAYLSIGNLNFEQGYETPSSISTTSRVHLTAIATRELAHALGITGDLIINNNNQLSFSRRLTFFENYLYDDNGQKSQANLAITYQGSDLQAQNSFDIRKNGAYFLGDNVKNVLSKPIALGQLNGIPVSFNVEDGKILSEYVLSNFALKNGLMSRQNYQNYTMLMEVELAAMQDLGYIIDRANHFGSSIYENGATISNTKGYFLRSDSGDRYVSGRANFTPYGIGLHVYGQNNTITQKADLLAEGVGATGIRVDGSNNRLTISKGVNVYADGEYGTGLLVAYGKNQSITNLGKIRAIDATGIAVRFDFGNNIVGNSKEYRGSYIQSVDGVNLSPENILDELKGSMVNHFDIYGEVVGGGSAIYMSENALVDNITIHSGGKVIGNVVSKYEQRDENGQLRMTNINFGQPTESKSGTYTLTGNISGKNINVFINPGTTLLNGVHQINDLTIAQNAKLTGANNFTLFSLFNDGELELSGAESFMNVEGDYTQTAGSNLTMALSYNGMSRMNVAGNLSIDPTATLTIEAEKGAYFPHNATYAVEDFITEDNTTVTSFSASPQASARVTTPPSIIDGFLVDNIKLKQNSDIVDLAFSEDGSTIIVTRDADAYQRNATNKNNVKMAQVLDHLQQTGEIDLDMHEMHVGLDGMIADTAAFNEALSQLSSNAYSPLFQASLVREQHLNRLVNSLAMHANSADDWQSFATFFTARNTTRNSGLVTDNPRYGFNNNYFGVLAGVTAASQRYEGLLYGFHSTISHQHVKLKSLSRTGGESNNLSLGIHASYQPADKGLYLTGLARMGWEKKQFDRVINYTDYHSSHNAKWNGMTATANSEVGYRFPVNHQITLSPFIGLDYGYIVHHRLGESSIDGTRLTVEKQHKNSLLSRIGLDSKLVLNQFTLEGQLYWQHQLLNDRLTLKASYATDQQDKFDQTSLLGAKNAMGVKMGWGYQISSNNRIGVQAETTLFQAGFRNVTGNVYYTFQF